jgi:hypothetical protein
MFYSGFVQINFTTENTENTETNRPYFRGLAALDQHFARRRIRLPIFRRVSVPPW